MTNKEAIQVLKNHNNRKYELVNKRRYAVSVIEQDLEILEILKNAKKINWVGVPPLYEDVEFTITISKENKQKILNWLERKDD